MERKNQFTFEHLKMYMNNATCVEHWNHLRQHAKKHYSIEVINKLDSSGLIVKVLKSKIETV